MLKREREALEQLYSDVEDLESKIQDDNDPTTEKSLDDFIDHYLHLVVEGLVRLVSRTNLKFWQKIAFAIVVQFLKKLHDKKFKG